MQGLDDESELKESEEHHIELIEPREDAPEALQPTEEPLDFVAATVQQAVVFPRLQAGPTRRNDRNPSKIQRQLAGLIVVISAVHQQWERLGQRPQSGQQIAALGSVVHLAGRESERYRRSSIRGNQMNFGAPSAARFANRLADRFFNAPVPERPKRKSWPMCVRVFMQIPVRWKGKARMKPARTLAAMLVILLCALPSGAQFNKTAKRFHILPHIADGGGWRSSLLVTNVSESVSPCTLQLRGLSVDRFETAGGVAAAAETATFELVFEGGSLVWSTRNEAAEASGYATLDCVNPVVAQVVFASLDMQGAPAAMATVFSSQAAGVFQFPVLTPEATLGLAIANDTYVDSSCRLFLQDPRGAPLGEAVLSAPAQSSRAQLLNAAIAIPETFGGGKAVVSCDQQVAMIGLHFELRTDGTIRTFSTVPPAVLDTTPQPFDTTPAIAADRAALEALYDATSGPGWNDSTNWKTAAPLSEWRGVRTDEGRVIGLWLSRHNLTGTIPPELGNLTNLQDLYLNDNSLTGAIPSELGNLTNLRSLDLNDNSLTGTIPPELGNLTNLHDLYLNENSLTGAIPPELGNLTNLGALRLDNNSLTGTIPIWLGNLPNLNYLSLNSNSLTGTIPPELGNLTNLYYLSLNDNSLTGTIPPELGNLTNLNYLHLNENSLTGTIPPELGNLTNLQFLEFHGNSLTGTIPPPLGNLTYLGELRLDNNSLTGTLPSSLTNLRQLARFYFDDNDGLCAPADAAFQNWLSGISYVRGPICGDTPAGSD